MLLCLGAPKLRKRISEYFFNGFDSVNCFITTQLYNTILDYIIHLYSY